MKKLARQPSICTACLEPIKESPYVRVKARVTEVTPVGDSGRHSVYTCIRYYPCHTTCREATEALIERNEKAIRQLLKIGK